MKKFVALMLCAGLFGLSIFAQSGKTRPRIVTENQTKPSVETSETPIPSATPDANKRPPVLTGDVRPATTSPPNPDEAKVLDENEVIKVETNLVTIPVSVLDRDGRFISGLQKEDFQIFEDDAQQKIDYFVSVEQPFTVVLLLDVSNSTQFKIGEIQDAAITFVRQLRQNDRVMVISFDEKIRVLAQPTNNRRVLEDAIRQIDFGGGTSLYEAVDYTLKQELRRIEGRKAIVLFTDGVDTTSRRATYQSTIKDAEEIDAMIYPIRYDTSGFMNSGNSGGNSRQSGGGSVFGQILGAIITGGNVQIGGGGGGTSRGEYERGRTYLQGLATVSGGRNFEAQTTYNLDAAFSGIAEELRRQYAIGYYPEEEGQPGERRQIKVRVNKTNAVVRAKNSYVVGSNNKNTNAKQPVKQTPKLNGRLPF